MWIIVLFDLPTHTKKERRIASLFRKALKKDGFTMFQFSIYARCCASRENAAVHIKRAKNILPKEGKVSIMQITDKQFGMIETFHGQKEYIIQNSIDQLTLF